MTDGLTALDITPKNGFASLHSKRTADLDRKNILSRIQELDKDVELFLQDIDRQLRTFLRKSNSMVPDVKDLKEGVSFQLSTGGKRVRAALCATSCELFSGSYLRALNYAAAIEHLQNFTLVHDDIADGDTERRGQPTAWKRYGIAHGINIGDLFVSLSALSILDAPYSPSTKLDLMRIVAGYGLEIASGQSLDINLRQNDDPTVEEYIDCTRKKTGSFLAMATVGGAVIGGASKKDQHALNEFAMLAGTAFQIKDDILDLMGGKGRMIGSDILEGKRTLLVIYSGQNATKLQKKRLLHILNKQREENTPKEIQWVIDLYVRTGAIEYAEQVADQLIDQATAWFTGLPDTDAKYRFLRISQYLSRRMH